MRKWSVRAVLVLVVLLALASGAVFVRLWSALPTTSGALTVSGTAAPVCDPAGRVRHPAHPRVQRSRRAVRARLRARAGSPVADGVPAATGRGPAVGVDGAADAGHRPTVQDARALPCRGAGVDWLLARGAAVRRGVRRRHQRLPGGAPRRRLPVEFALFGVEPAPWTPADVVVWPKVMALTLSTNYRDEILRARIIARAGQDDGRRPAARVERRVAGDPSRGYPGGTGALRPVREGRAMPSVNRAPVDRGARRAPCHAPARLAVRREHARRQQQLGGVRRDVRSPASPCWPTTRTSGASPVHVVSRAPRGRPAQRHRRDAAGRARGRDRAQRPHRLGPDQPDGRRAGPLRRAGQRAERGRVQRRLGTDARRARDDPRQGTSRTCRSSSAPRATGRSSPTPSSGRAEALALRWTALEPDDPTLEAFLGVMIAGDWDEFTAALSGYRVPIQNWVFADVDGNIGYFAPGCDSGAGGRRRHRARTRLDSAYEWAGFVPPSSARASTTRRGVRRHRQQQGLAETSYPHLISTNWEAGTGRSGSWNSCSRQRRALVDDFARVQADVSASSVTVVLPWMRRAVIPPTSRGGTRTAFDRVMAWDGACGTTASAPPSTCTGIAGWSGRCSRTNSARSCGPTSRVSSTGTGKALHRLITTSDDRWCDDTAHRATARRARSVLAAALAAAVADMRAFYRTDDIEPLDLGQGQRGRLRPPAVRGGARGCGPSSAGAPRTTATRSR